MKILLEPFILFWIRFCYRFLRLDLVYKYIDTQTKSLSDHVNKQSDSVKQEYSLFMQDMREAHRNQTKQIEEDKIWKSDILATLRRIAEK